MTSRVSQQSKETLTIEWLTLEAELRRALPNPRFLPYVQLHEFEALVFADLDQLALHVPGAEVRRATEQLKRDAASCPPELVNNGVDTAPSKRLLRALPTYSKTLHGPLVALHIGLPVLRRACPHFGQWLGRLEKLTGCGGL